MGLGNSTIVGIGGDPVVGSSFIDILAKFQADPETEYVVMVGEIGGDEEEKAAAFIEAELTKPVVAYIAGFTAPPGKTMGHAGAIISGSVGHGRGEEGRARGEGDPGRHDADRDGRDRRRGRARLSSGRGEAGQQRSGVPRRWSRRRGTRPPRRVSARLPMSGPRPRSRLLRPPQLSVAERVARGKAARREVPRSSHAVFEPAADRPDPVELLERQADARVPELVPIRYGRMLASPFTFYRGAALIMASDLAATPRSGFDGPDAAATPTSPTSGSTRRPSAASSSTSTTSTRRCPGPWEWDVKRLAVSMLIAARDNEFAVARAGAGSCSTRSREYRRWMARVRRRCETSRSGTRSFEIESLLPELRARVDAEMRRRLDRRRREGASAATACRRSRKLAAKVDGRAPDRLAAAADRAARRLRRTSRDATALRADARAADAASTAHAPARLAQAARAVPARRHRPARWSASAASGPPPGSRCSSAGAGSDRLVLQIKEAQRIGARGVRRRRASTRTPASASSPGSASCRRRATSSSAGSASRRASSAPRATTTSASSRLEGVRCGRGDERAGARPSTAQLCAATLAHAMRAPATGSRSRATSAAATPSTGRCSRSPRPTPSRTSATTPPSRAAVRARGARRAGRPAIV